MNTSYINEKYLNAQNISIEFLDTIKNKRIIDFHFVYDNSEPTIFEHSYIELENHTFLYEINSGPVGITSVDLHIITKEEFDNLKKEIENETDTKVKSFLNDIHNVQ